MSAQTFQTIAPRPAPINTDGWVAWCKTNLFSDWKTSLGTAVIGAVLLAILPPLFRWAILNATWVPDHEVCHQAAGACWGVVREKFRFIIFGRYPFDEHWRALIATAMLLSLIIASCMRVCWKAWLPVLWAAVLAVYFTLMYGGVLGLAKVETDM